MATMTSRRLVPVGFEHGDVVASRARGVIRATCIVIPGLVQWRMIPSPSVRRSIAATWGMVCSAIL